MPDTGSLKEKTVKGLLWSFIDLMAKGGMQLLVQIILARLLLPEHFGLIGMIIVFIVISDTIIDSGFSQALIRDKNTSQTDYSTIFYFNLMIAIVLYVLIYLFSGSVSNFFEEPQLTSIIRVLSLVLIVNSLGLTQRIMLIKNVDFKTITKVNIIAVIASGAITITMALMGFGVWSLVVHSLAMQSIQTLFLWFFNKWIPSIVFSMKSFQKFFKFGYKLLISSLIDTFYNNLIFVIIGKFYSPTQLGYYTNANKFRDLAAYSISTTVQRVSYPVLSSIQDDEDRLKSGFRKIIKTSALINFPLMIGLAAIAMPLFTLVLGDKWIPAVIYFQLLCIAGMLYPIHLANLNILQVKGRSDLFLLIEIIKKALLTILILSALFFKLGIIGLICATLVNSFASLYINSYFSSKEIAYSTFEQFKDLFPIFTISIVMGGIVLVVGNILPDYQLLKIVIQVGVGIVIYIIGCRLFRVKELDNINKLILGFIPKVKLFLYRDEKEMKKL